MIPLGPSLSLLLLGSGPAFVGREPPSSQLSSGRICFAQVPLATQLLDRENFLKAIHEIKGTGEAWVGGSWNSWSGICAGGRQHPGLSRGSDKPGLAQRRAKRRRVGADSAPPGMNWGEAVNLGVPLFFPQSNGLGREGGRVGPRQCSSVLCGSSGFWGGCLSLSLPPTHNISWPHIWPVASTLKLANTGRQSPLFFLSEQPNQEAH